MTAAEVAGAVRRYYGAEHSTVGPEWAVLSEFSLAPGAGHGRADLFCVRAWSSAPKRHERHTIEVKVSRADLRNELAAPDKSRPFDEVSHRFFLAVPAGLLREDDPLPDHWGVYEIGARGGVRRVRNAVRRTEVAAVPEKAFVEAFRRAWRAEARIRDAHSDDDPAAVAADLARQVTSLTRSRDTAVHQATRAQSDLASILRHLATGGGWWCVCGKPTTPGQNLFSPEHADKTPCEQAWYGDRPEIDLFAAAKALGLTSVDDVDRRRERTPREQLEEIRHLLSQPEPDGECLARIRAVLTPDGDGARPDGD